MARKRMLDPEFWLDEGLAQLSAHARLLYMGLWGICDDNYATLPNKPGWIKAQVFPYENVKIDILLQQLADSGKIIKFIDNNEEYYFIKNFFKYQKVDRPSAAKYPEFTADSRVLDEPSTSTRPEEKLREVKRREAKRTQPPQSIEELKELIRSHPTLPSLKTKYPDRDYAFETEKMGNWWIEKHGSLPARPMSAFTNWIKGTEPDPTIAEARRKAAEKQRTEKLLNVEGPPVSAETLDKLREATRNLVQAKSIN